MSAEPGSAVPTSRSLELGAYDELRSAYFTERRELDFEYRETSTVISAGPGTSAYTFYWGMGGENQDYSDVNPGAIASLR
jgi:5-keto 4-deoxyuronate isomerase